MKTVKFDYTITGTCEIQVSDDVYRDMLNSDFDTPDDIGLDDSTILDHVGQCDRVDIEWRDAPEVAE